MRTAFSFQKVLWAFYAFVGILIAVRIFYTGSTLYLFLVWNIFLAWIPCIISSLFKKMADKLTWKQALVFCCWLAFFPNALYIVTDLIHIQHESIVPKWFDALLLFSSALLGLMLAFISLYRVETFLNKVINKKLRPPFILLILFLGSFGVYLGRFLRWNSWDIITNPMQLLLSVSHRIISPFDHLQTWGITVVFTVFFYLLYITIKKLPGYLSQATF
ncbi:MAG: DUF1361 domain-containing protein [Ferruginibacter sp.]|nr:DUF1361 domain-containing protein [Ferruginibacter sp.]